MYNIKQKITEFNIDRKLKKHGLPALFSPCRESSAVMGENRTITSTEIGSIAKYTGEKIAVELVAKAGFDAWDFSMFRNMAKYDWKKGSLSIASHPLSGDDYLAYARELKKIGEDNGIFCNQAHAPFPSVDDMRPFLKRALECTAEAGGKICVVHPCNTWTVEQNAELYFDLLPFAASCGVKIAAENMWNWDQKAGHALPAPCSDPKAFIELLDAVNDDHLVACLDIGHAEMKGLNTSAVEMIRALGSRLAALHIHDNDKLHDSHQIPYSMNIDFAPIIRALSDIGYSGEFTLEADAFVKKRSLVSDVIKLGAVARKMADEFDALKKE